METQTSHGCLPLALLIGLVVIVPFFFANIILAALLRLGLTPEQGVLAALGIFLGGVIDIPIRKIKRSEIIESPMLSMYGVGRFFPGRIRREYYTIIAVNLGGCIIPCILVIYELIRILHYGLVPLLLTLAAIAVNVLICYYMARPLPKIGITMPALAPAFAAAVCGLLFYRELAPVIAFCAGVTGPLIGADLLHLKEINRINTGMASIGGAGTFDGIVLSGLIATLLA